MRFTVYDNIIETWGHAILILQTGASYRNFCDRKWVISVQKVAHACLFWHRTSKCGQLSSCEEETWQDFQSCHDLSNKYDATRNQLPWKQIVHEIMNACFCILFKTDKDVFIVLSVIRNNKNPGENCGPFPIDFW
jgi:hypothetical protein